MTDLPNLPQTGLSFYEITQNPELLRKMTCEPGDNLSYNEQVAKLETMMAKARNKKSGKKPPEILS